MNDLAFQYKKHVEGVFYTLHDVVDMLPTVNETSEAVANALVEGEIERYDVDEFIEQHVKEYNQ